MAQGLIKTTKTALTPQQKTLAAQALIMKQTKDAQGDFARTSGGLANQQKILSAQFQDVKTKIGTALLPIVTKVVTFFNNQAGPAFKAVGERVKPLIDGVKNLASGFKTGSNGSATFSTALAKIGPILTTVKGIISGAVSFVRTMWQLFGADITRYVIGALNNALQFISGVLTIIRGVIQTVTALIRGDWKGVWNGIKTIVRGAWTAIGAIVKQALNLVKTAMSAAWTVIKTATSAAWNGLKGVVSSAISGIVTLAKGIKNKVVGAVKGAGKWLYESGKNMIQGLIDGAGSLLSQLGKFLLDKVPGWIKGPFKKALGINSPSKVFAGYGKNIVQGLIKGISEGKSSVEKTISRMSKDVRKFGKVPDYLNKQFKAARKAASAQEALNKRLDEAKANLASLKKTASDYANNVASAVIQTGNITTFLNSGQALNAESASQSIINDLKQQVAEAQRFARLITSLRKAGLNKTSLDQIIQAGVGNGTATAEALLSGGQAAIKEVNGLTTQLTKTGNSLGQTAANSMYGAGIAAAQGLVKGLTANKAALAKTIKGIASTLAKEFRRALGIKSPSKVFKGYGLNVVQGLARGLSSDAALAKVGNAMNGLSGTVTNGFDGKPQLRLSETTGKSPTYNITIKADATTDQVKLGRELTKAIDAFEKSGGRRAA